MTVSGAVLPIAGGGEMLCAWLLGTDLLLAALMIASILLRLDDAIADVPAP